MKTKFRQAFFSHFFIDRNDTLMMLVFLNYFQYWIYTKIRVYEVFPWESYVQNKPLDTLEGHESASAY